VSEVDPTIYEVADRLDEMQQDAVQKRLKYAESVKKIADSLPIKPNYVPTMARFIQKAMVEDECVFYMVYGPLRYGKSSYSFKTLAAVYDTWNPQILKNFIIFKPSEFLTILKKVIDMKRKFPCFVWDDAGVWLNSMKWNEPLLRRISEYFNVVGTHFNSVIFTTPLPMYVLSRLRGLPNCSNIRIYKMNQIPNKMRIARGYYQWMLPDLKKTGVKPFLNDEFSAILPTMFYEWYQPYRQVYADEGFTAIETQLYQDASEHLANEQLPQVNMNAKSMHQTKEEIPVVVNG